MFEDRKVVIVTPAGRRRYMELLVPQILALRPVADEYRLWVNTKNQDDIEYMKELEATYPDFIKLQYLTVPHNGNATIYTFFKNHIEPNTVYVRFDDDIVFVDDIESFKKLVAFRIANPQYFMVYGNILNNAIISHIHQRNLALNIYDGLIGGYACMDHVGWNVPEFAEGVHMDVLRVLENDGNLNSFHMKNWLLYHFERVSINCVSWLGEEFAQFGGEVGVDEEQWLSVDKPIQIGKPNCIFGDFCCVHYGFYTQRPHLDTTDILDKYRAIVEKKLKTA